MSREDKLAANSAGSHRARAVSPLRSLPRRVGKVGERANGTALLYLKGSVAEGRTKSHDPLNSTVQVSSLEAGQNVSNSDPTINPYAPAATIDAEPLVDARIAAEEIVEPRSLRRVAIRWLIVCSLSAIPSFFFGLAITEGRAAGMIVGILLFVIGYTILDYRTAGYRIRQKKTIQRTLKIAYGTRIAISILFPLGMYIDLVCGLLSVGLTQSITGHEFRDSDPMSFLAAVFTTLVQGTVLNIVLACYALLVHVAQLIVIAMRR